MSRILARVVTPVLSHLKIGKVIQRLSGFYKSVEHVGRGGDQARVGSILFGYRVFCEETPPNGQK